MTTNLHGSTGSETPLAMTGWGPGQLIMLIAAVLVTGGRWMMRKARRV